jgi:hypothetical protein
MTLQLGLVGRDGIVLASDLKTLFFDEVMTGGLTSKILTDAKNGILLAFSGYEISQKVARAILADPNILDTDDPRHSIEELATQVYHEPFPDHATPPRTDSEILIVSLRNLNHLYSLEMKSTRCLLNVRKDKAVAGHQTNTAVFFTERYYTRGSVFELAFLAAHTILEASKLNPCGIEGVEIFVCTREGFKSLSDSEIAVLKKESDKLDRCLGNALRKQHF